MVSNVLFVLSGVIFAIAFVIYNWKLLRGKSDTVFTAWALFTLVTFVNGATYLSVTASWLTIFLFGVDCVGCAVTVVFVLIRKRFRVTIKVRDRWFALISVAAIIVWLVFRQAAFGNLLNLIPYTLAWCPLWWGIIENPGSEPVWPWSMDSVAFVLNIVALKLQHDAHAIDYVSPVVFLLYHAFMTALSMRKANPALVAVSPEAPSL